MDKLKIRVTYFLALKSRVVCFDLFISKDSIENQFNLKNLYLIKNVFVFNICNNIKKAKHEDAENCRK
mgnify:CR=1 FL=1